jgi:hypothetical protein
MLLFFLQTTINVLLACWDSGGFMKKNIFVEENAGLRESEYRFW